MDIAHKKTDEALEDLEKRIIEHYKQAADEVTAKLNRHLAAFAKKDKKKRESLEAGFISEDDYKKWRYGQIMTGKRWEEMRNTLAEDLVHADEIAMSMVGEHMPEVYALNHNYGTFEIESQSGIDTSYSLYDRETVEQLIRDTPELLPPPKVDIPKDLRWNRQHITSAVAQGVLQGESIPNISRRLRQVTDMDRTGALRNARTMTTAAENSGRMAAYKRAEEKGIESTQVWVATLDGRTRHSHRFMHGQRVKIGESFKTEDGDLLRFPGDPEGPAREVYNCRCTMISQIKGFEFDITKESARMDGQSFEEWQNAKPLSRHKDESLDQYETRLKARNAGISITRKKNETKKDYYKRLRKELDKKEGSK